MLQTSTALAISSIAFAINTWGWRRVAQSPLPPDGAAPGQRGGTLLRVQAASDMMAALAVLTSSWACPETRHSRPEEGEHKGLLSVAAARGHKKLEAPARAGAGGGAAPPGCRQWGQLWVPGGPCLLCPQPVPPGLAPTQPSQWGQLPMAGTGIDGKRFERLQMRRLHR